ncbi:hypothetical protein [Thiobacter aerophilum]|uniref:Uncharacterized protein n=1 Tax=Thiobacter aerophilum TaxID=3121275 RepID=A0ABV0EEG9_9BURK
MVTRHVMRNIALGLLFMGMGHAWAGTDADLKREAATTDKLTSSQPATEVTSRFARDFAQFAGSQENAEALISGLRSGTPITLSGVSAAGTTTTTTITPPTRPMGYGNTYISLSLAKTQLAQYGITDPTPEVLKAALTGGSFTVTKVAPDGTVSTQTVTLEGILNQRAAGMGWGQIAQANGFKLGPVVSSMKAANHNFAAGRTAAVAVPRAAKVEQASSHRHAYGKGITTAASGGGVVYGTRELKPDSHVAKAEGAPMGGGQGGSKAPMTPVGLTHAAGAAPGMSANAPGHTKAR